MLSYMPMDAVLRRLEDARLPNALHRWVVTTRDVTLRSSFFRLSLCTEEHKTNNFATYNEVVVPGERRRKSLVIQRFKALSLRNHSITNFT